MNTLQEIVGQNLPVFWIVSIITVMLGLLACFMGYRLKKFWIGVVGLGTGFLTGFLVSRIFLESTWLCIGIGVLCAAVLAVLAFSFYRAGVFLMCAAIMFFVIKALLHEEEWWVYLISALAGIAAGVAGICFVKQMLVAVTGFLGAYFAVQAVWNMAELDLPLFQIAAVIALAVCGMAVQFYFAKKKENAAENGSAERITKTTRYEAVSERRKSTREERHLKHERKTEVRDTVPGNQSKTVTAPTGESQRARHERRRQNRESQKGDTREI